ncbi:hypothetical protein [Aurantiacibacter gangjinensis]|uniref:Uncharacterized protein n=1 Tax=Aurantiacibacter gangjinensis TaxID=502682 RepID=A0A0G9MKF5_9SPHN|nr:hypothetical protein [Aurantiacibacter gangjinensis]APE29464.1 hypothetical protein BMF35_b0209 [Aurantiacibacter gangjinensis]KLE31157.1 hypothetical protein AAW01_13100 [Aurantiacibacter gangjinensis]
MPVFQKATAAICTVLAMGVSTAGQAQTASEEVQSAQPLNSDEWQREIARDVPSLQRFYGLPELRFGLLVDTAGNVRTCLALPLEGEAEARGQALCPSLAEHARFEPARDGNGNPVESVFVAHFAASESTNVTNADLAGVPVL